MHPDVVVQFFGIWGTKNPPGRQEEGVTARKSGGVTTELDKHINWLSTVRKPRCLAKTNMYRTISAFFLTRREKGTDLRKINCSIVVFINQVEGFLLALGHLRVICPCELIPVGQRLFYLHHLDLEVEHGTPGDEVVCNAMLRLNQGVPTWGTCTPMAYGYNCLSEGCIWG